MCGIIGIYSRNKNVAETLKQALCVLQHRGQQTWGVLTYEGVGDQRFHSFRERGFVTDPSVGYGYLLGTIGIGHVRYSTSGGVAFRNAQPYFCESRLNGNEFGIGIAHNGNLLNTEALRNRHLDNGSIYQSTSDTEVILHLIALSKKNGFEARLIDALTKVKGAYSLVILTEERKLIGVRDPRGFRPLSLAQKDGDYFLASETCVWDELDVDFVREIEPGEMIVISDSGVESSFPFKKQPCTHCSFEQFYFASPDSLIDGLQVSGTRYDVGKKLALVLPVTADFVCPVPDSGVSAAQGYARTSGLPIKNGIIRNNHYSGRTFIQPTESLRQNGVRKKYRVDSGVVRGKRVIVVDDSIVRGKTMKNIVEKLRKAGAVEVHLRIASPQFRYHCKYGIDTPSDYELIASQMTEEEMRIYFNADSLAFVSVENVHQALGEENYPKETRFCNACFTGKYPV